MLLWVIWRAVEGISKDLKRNSHSSWVLQKHKLNQAHWDYGTSILGKWNRIDEGFDTNKNKHTEPHIIQVTMGETEEILAMNLKR